MKKQWNDYVREQMVKKGFTQDDIAERMEKSQGAVGHWLTGRRSANFNDVVKILKIVETEKVILNSDGTLSSLNDDVEVIGKPKDGLVAVVGEATMGRDGRMMLEPLHTGYVNIHSSDPDAYAVRCKGSSMEPRIKSGEFAVVEPNTPYLNGDDVLIRTVDNEYMIKTFEYKRDGEYRFSSINNAHDPFNLQESEIVYIHTVSGILKRSRFISFEEISE